MGHFIQLGKNKYKLVADLGYRGKKRIRKTRTVTAKNDREAARLLVLFEEEIMKDKNVYLTNTENMTLAQLYPKWRDYAEPHFAPKTFQNYCSYIENRVIPFFGDFRLTDIKKIDIIYFINDLSKNGKRTDTKRFNDPDGRLSASSIRNIFKAFSSLMKAAYEWNLITNNPCLGIKLPKLDTPEGQVYSEKEVKLLLERLQERSKPIKKLLVEFAIVSGARLGEIAALEAKHLNGKNNTVLIEQTITTIKGDNTEERQVLKETKGKKKRRVTIPQSIMEDLLLLARVKQSQLNEVGNEREWDGHVFLFSNPFGKPYNVSSLSAWWSRFLRKNPDLPKITFHELRHTSASLLIFAGEHPKVIQSRLGHSDIKLTMNTYGHLLPESDQRASSYFDKFFEEK